MKNIFFFLLIVALVAGGYYFYQKIESIENRLSEHPSKNTYGVSGNTSVKAIKPHPPEYSSKTIATETPRNNNIIKDSGALLPLHIQKKGLSRSQYPPVTILIQVKNKYANVLEKEAKLQRRSFPGQIEYILAEHAKKSKYYDILEDTSLPPTISQKTSMAQSIDASTKVMVQLDNQYAQVLAKEAREQHRSLFNHIEYIISGHAKKSKFYKKKKSKK